MSVVESMTVVEVAGLVLFAMFAWLVFGCGYIFAKNQDHVWTITPPAIVSLIVLLVLIAIVGAQ